MNNEVARIVVPKFDEVKKKAVFEYGVAFDEVIGLLAQIISRRWLRLVVCSSTTTSFNFS